MTRDEQSPAAPAETAPTTLPPAIEDALKAALDAAICYGASITPVGEETTSARQAATERALRAALSSASATEAALRAEVERLTRERIAIGYGDDGTPFASAQSWRAAHSGAVKRAEAAESREAALRGERDEACEALAEILSLTDQHEAPGPRIPAALWLRSRSVLARIRKETP